MGRMKVIYKNNTKINGIMFLYGVESFNKSRRGLFICPSCKETYEAEMANVKNGHSKGCGCNKGKATNRDALIKFYNWLSINENNAHNVNELVDLYLSKK